MKTEVNLEMKDKIKSNIHPKIIEFINAGKYEINDSVISACGTRLHIRECYWEEEETDYVFCKGRRFSRKILLLNDYEKELIPYIFKTILRKHIEKSEMELRRTF